MGRRRINRSRQRRQELREQAAELMEERSKRTPEQQLMILDKRLGEFRGATKERQRLMDIIERRNRETNKRQANEQKTEQKITTKNSRRKGNRTS